MKATVIISTYNSPKWLEKVIWGYMCQTVNNFELIVADDGSTHETEKLINRYQKIAAFQIKHIWHEDLGFRKTKILNKAILASESEYLIFSDGDCIPKKDFIETHLSCSEKGYYLSGGYYKLSMDISYLISKEHVESGVCFTKDWLYTNGQPKSFKINKLKATGIRQYLLNKLTPTSPTWNGHNASGWKSDLMKINGFNEQMEYGGEDCELGDRLVNLGIKPKQIRYSAIVIHLDHKRGYVNEVALKKNKEIRKDTQDKKRIKTHFGIEKLTNKHR